MMAWGRRSTGWFHWQPGAFSLSSGFSKVQCVEFEGKIIFISMFLCYVTFMFSFIMSASSLSEMFLVAMYGRER